MMKYIVFYIIIVVGLVPFLGFGQSLQLIEAKATAHGEAGETLRTAIKVQNNSKVDLNFKIIQRSVNIKADQLAYFMVGNSLIKGGKEQLTSKVITLKPNEILDSFSGFLTSDFQTGNTQVSYTFINTEALEDSLVIPATYNVHLPSLDNHIFSNENFILSKLYPNPATEFIVFDYKLSPKIPMAAVTVRNILGTELKKEEIPQWQNEVRISVMDLKPGVYFYSISIEDRNLLTRKFMVKK